MRDLQQSSRDDREATIGALDRGELRLAEKSTGEWLVHAWVQQAILLYFRLRQLETWQIGQFEYHDKIPLKHDYERLGVRVVPPAVARYGSYLEPGVIMMPSYVNIGAHVGSGSVVVADDRACVVDLARILTRFCASEACGKTIPCRIGTRRLVEIADRVVDGRPRPTDMVLLEDLSADIAASALCDHERLTTLPLLSGMRYFRSELDEHILRSACPAGVCHPIAVAAGAIP